MILNDIKTPDELYKYMDENIEYGYLGKDGNIYKADNPEFDDKWFDYYLLESPEEVIKNKIGICWDQVELERKWFEKNKFEYKTYFEIVDVNYENNYSTHTFLIYKDNNKWHYFENADYDNRGIYSFDSIEELLDFQKEKYIIHLKEENIKDEEIDRIKRVLYQKPTSHISAREFIEFVLK